MALIVCSDVVVVGSPVERWNIDAPTRPLAVEVFTQPTRKGRKRLLYQVSLNGDLVVSPSELSIQQGVQRRGKRIQSFVEVSASKVLSVRDAWNPTWGANSASVLNHYNSRSFATTLASVGRVTILFRVFDDGLAIRLVYLDSPKHVRDITEFNFELSYETTVYATKSFYDMITPFSLSTGKGSRKHQSKRVRGFSSSWANTPITLKLASPNRFYVTLHEADIQFDHEPIHVSRSLGKVRFVSARFSASSVWHTSWKTIQIATKAGDLLTSDLLLNLNPPPVGDFSWVVAGIASWDWRFLGSKLPGNNTQEIWSNTNLNHMKLLVDFAHERGFPYVLIDAKWYGRDEEHDDPHTPACATCMHPRDLVQYSLSLAQVTRGTPVKILLYVNAATFRRIPDTRLRSLLDMYRNRWGVAGIKLGFVQQATAQGRKGRMKDRPSEAYREMRRVLQMCAERELVVVVHEPGSKPSGLERTFPNLLSTEYTFSMLDGPERARALTPGEVAYLPFVHGMAGPMDRSPGLFALDTFFTRPTAWRQQRSTIMNQIAQGWIYRTGLWTLPDSPDSYENPSKSVLVNLLSTMQAFGQVAQWTFCQAELAKAESFVVKTKKRLNLQQYLMCGLAGSQMHLELDFSFLNPSHKYEATLYIDGPARSGFFGIPKKSTRSGGRLTPRQKRRAIRVTRRELFEVREIPTLTSQSTVSISIAQGGGFCALVVMK